MCRIALSSQRCMLIRPGDAGGRGRGLPGDLGRLTTVSVDRAATPDLAGGAGPPAAPNRSRSHASRSACSTSPSLQPNSRATFGRGSGSQPLKRRRSNLCCASRSVFQRRRNSSRLTLSCLHSPTPRATRRSRSGVHSSIGLILVSPGAPRVTGRDRVHAVFEHPGGSSRASLSRDSEHVFAFALTPCHICSCRGRREDGRGLGSRADLSTGVVAGKPGWPRERAISLRVSGS